MTAIHYASKCHYFHNYDEIIITVLLRWWKKNENYRCQHRFTLVLIADVFARMASFKTLFSMNNLFKLVEWNEKSNVANERHKNVRQFKQSKHSMNQCMWKRQLKQIKYESNSVIKNEKFVLKADFSHLILLVIYAIEIIHFLIYYKKQHKMRNSSRNGY